MSGGRTKPHEVKEAEKKKRGDLNVQNSLLTILGVLTAGRYRRYGPWTDEASDFALPRRPPSIYRAHSGEYENSDLWFCSTFVRPRSRGINRDDWKAPESRCSAIQMAYQDLGLNSTVDTESAGEAHNVNVGERFDTGIASHRVWRSKQNRKFNLF